jgi:hypothetical protein
MKISVLFLIIILVFQHNRTEAISPAPYYVTCLNNPSPGYLIMDSYQPSYLEWIDNSGQPIYIKNMNTIFHLTNIQVQPNGMLTYFANEKFYALDSNFNLIDSFKCVGNYFTDYHDFTLLPNGHVLMLGQEIRTIDMDTVVKGGKKNVMVTGNVIQELDENKKVVFEWNTFDHFKFTDHVPDNDLYGFAFDLTHVNTVTIDLDSNILMSSRFLDEITKINRKTGEIIWRLGGAKCKNNQFTFTNDTIYGFWGFSHQHCVTRLTNGNLLLFDNGNSRPYPFSRAVEYKLDEVNKTATRVWQYRTFPDTYTSAMGSVQRFPNGNTLIGWGTNFNNLTMTELHPDNSKAMEIYYATSYRVHRYVYKSCAKLMSITKAGNYDFNDNKNPTSVTIDLTSTEDSGFVSVERHYYKPCKIKLFASADNDIYPNRWVINNFGIKGIDGIIKFDITKIINIKPAETTIYARQIEGSGTFFPLDTKYDSLSNSLQADISGFGEFILCMPPIIAKPLLNYPDDNSKNIATNISLTWDTVKENLKYRFQLSKYSNFFFCTLDSNNINNSYIECNKLENETKYYWRVKALLDTNESDWSEVRSFTTMPKQELDAPTLITPMTGTFGVPVTGKLQWYPVTGAKYYDVQVSSSPDFQTLTVERNDLNTWYLYYNNLDINTSYFWRVAAINDVTESSWSEIWNFTTEVFTSVSQQNDDTIFRIVNGYDNSIYIKLRLDKQDNLSFSIYDNLGTEVSHKENKLLDIGEHLIKIDSEKYFSGFYVYKIIIGGTIYQGKFIYLRQ